MALADALGNLIDFRLLPGQAHDLRGTAALLEGLSTFVDGQVGPADPAGFDVDQHAVSIGCRNISQLDLAGSAIDNSLHDLSSLGKPAAVGGRPFRHMIE